MRILTLILLTVFCSSCSSKMYNYKIVLEKPEKSEVRSYENDTMSIAFNFLDKGITFKLFNKSEEGIRINWDELSMSINGKAQRVVHKETGSYSVTSVQPPTTIPPKTVLEDAIFPTEFISYVYVRGNKTVKLNELYPKYDYGNKKKRDEIMKMKGQKVVIFFPFYMRNVYVSKTFEFIIEDITTHK